MESVYSGKNSIEIESKHPYGTCYVILAKIAKTFGGSSIFDKNYEAK